MVTNLEAMSSLEAERTLIRMSNQELTEALDDFNRKLQNEALSESVANPQSFIRMPGIIQMIENEMARRTS